MMIESDEDLTNKLDLVFKNTLINPDTGKYCRNWFLICNFEDENPSSFEISGKGTDEMLVNVTAKFLSVLEEKEFLKSVAESYKSLTKRDLISDLQKF